MFGKRVRIFRLSGFDVYVDFSWVFLAVLVTWSLATGVFPHELTGQTSTAYWLMGAAGALGLFLSIVLHEFAHSVVARANGIRMRGITLFIFGGVAEMLDEPPSPQAEFKMAIAGPIASLLIGGACFGLAALAHFAELTQVGVTLRYLADINVLLAVFNMVPAFPLDGGRVLRSILWNAKGSIRQATRISSTIGSGFGLLLIALGVASLLMGYFVMGLWWILLGSFVRTAAAQSYEQILLRQYLQGEPVHRFMNRSVISVPPDLPLDRFVEDFVYRYHYKMFPVVHDESVLGCASSSSLTEVPRERWHTLTVRDAMEPCNEATSIHPNTDTLEALGKMMRSGRSRLLVVENGRLIGLLSLRDVIDFFNLKVQLDEPERRAG
ncbi:MAG: site-2 protease family protein [Armatimonadota bacterium]